MLCVNAQGGRARGVLRYSGATSSHFGETEPLRTGTDCVTEHWRLAESVTRSITCFCAGAGGNWNLVDASEVSGGWQPPGTEEQNVAGTPSANVQKYSATDAPPYTADAAALNVVFAFFNGDGGLHIKEAEGFWLFAASVLEYAPHPNALHARMRYV